MHPFAVGLICFLAGAIAGILFANHYAKGRESAAFAEGRKLEQDAQALRNSARAQKAARTRRNKALPDTDFTKSGE
jgi:hypothetical protein